LTEITLGRNLKNNSFLDADKKADIEINVDKTKYRCMLKPRHYNAGRNHYSTHFNSFIS
jgi:hypothetical protein